MNALARLVDGYGDFMRNILVPIELVDFPELPIIVLLEDGTLAGLAGSNPTTYEWYGLPVLAKDEVPNGNSSS